MNFNELKETLKCDIYRHYGRFNFLIFIKELIWGFGGRFTIWLRISVYLKQKGILFSPLYIIARIFHRHYVIKYGFDIPITTSIGSGFYLGHFGAIVISHLATIGCNCNISHGVTIGIIPRGPRSGAPIIGNNVYFGPGSKVIGKIRVGNNVAIGANCVVTRDVPDNAVVVGIPAKVISFNGSDGYITRVKPPSANFISPLSCQIL